MSRAILDEPFRTIAGLVQADAKLISHRPLTGGVSAQIDALIIARPDEMAHEVVVRQHRSADWKPQAPDVTSVEYGLQLQLFEAGVRVPRPLLLDSSGEVLPSPYLVMELVEGSTVVEPHQLDIALDQMADFLTHLHGLEVSEFNLQQLPEREDPVAGALEYLPDDESWAIVRARIAGWEMSGGRISLLHGDFWPGNVLWRGDELAAVIDWEDAAVGDALSDVACCRAELMVMYGEEAVERFSQRYFSVVDCETKDLAVWEIYACSAALATMAEWGLEPKVEAERRERTERFLELAVGVLVSR